MVLQGDVCSVYRDIEGVKRNIAAIREYLSEDSGFEIIYGDLDIYLKTRRGIYSRSPQQEVDELLQ